MDIGFEIELPIPESEELSAAVRAFNEYVAALPLTFYEKDGLTSVAAEVVNKAKECGFYFHKELKDYYSTMRSEGMTMERLYEGFKVLNAKVRKLEFHDGDMAPDESTDITEG